VEFGLTRTPYECAQLMRERRITRHRLILFFRRAGLHSPVDARMRRDRFITRNSPRSARAMKVALMTESFFIAQLIWRHTTSSSRSTFIAMSIFTGPVSPWR